MNALTLAALGTGFTFLMTTLGSAMVFLLRRQRESVKMQRIFMGFAAGVMIAASVWSLLIPSIEMAGEQGVPGWLPAAGGFALGALFLMVLDALMPHLHPGSSEAEGVHTSFKRTTLLVLAVTLHNIPEGMAVGLACALAAGGGSSSVTLAGCVWAWGCKISLRVRPFRCRCGARGFPVQRALSMVRSRVSWSPSAASWPCLSRAALRR